MLPVWLELGPGISGVENIELPMTDNPYGLTPCAAVSVWKEEFPTRPGRLVELLLATMTRPPPPAPAVVPPAAPPATLMDESAASRSLALSQTVPPAPPPPAPP